jgi:hypothetical protein
MSEMNGACLRTMVVQESFARRTGPFRVGGPGNSECLDLEQGPRLVGGGGRARFLRPAPPQDRLQAELRGGARQPIGGAGRYPALHTTARGCQFGFGRTATFRVPGRGRGPRVRRPRRTRLASAMGLVASSIADGGWQQPAPCKPGLHRAPGLPHS